MRLSVFSNLLLSLRSLMVTSKVWCGIHSDSKPFLLDTLSSQFEDRRYEVLFNFTIHFEALTDLVHLLKTGVYGTGVLSGTVRTQESWLLSTHLLRIALYIQRPPVRK